MDISRIWRDHKLSLLGYENYSIWRAVTAIGHDD